jgi:hypothetical protein
MTDNEEIVFTLPSTQTYWVDVVNTLNGAAVTYDIGISKNDGGADPSLAPTVSLPFATNIAVFGASDEEWFKVLRF